MAIRMWVGEIQFNDNTIIPISKNEIVVFVGPNNAGKSVTLKEIVGLIKANHYKAIVF